MNAAFPYVTLSSVLPITPRTRVADAGYYDNYGVNIVCGWMDDLVQHHRAWMNDWLSGILVIQIRDGVSELTAEKPGAARRGATTPIARGLEGLLGPIQTVLAARQSVPAFRNDEQLEALGATLNAPGRDFFRTVVFEYEGEASLSWYLSQAEINDLKKRAQDLVGERVEEFRAWWGEEACKPKKGA